MNLTPDQEQRAAYLGKCINCHDLKTPRLIEDAARELIYLRDEVEYLRALVKAHAESTNRRQLIGESDGYVMLKEPPA